MTIIVVMTTKGHLLDAFFLLFANSTQVGEADNVGHEGLIVKSNVSF